MKRGRVRHRSGVGARGSCGMAKCGGLKTLFVAQTRRGMDGGLGFLFRSQLGQKSIKYPYPLELCLSRFARIEDPVFNQSCFLRAGGIESHSCEDRRVGLPVRVKGVK